MRHLVVGAALASLLAAPAMAAEGGAIALRPVHHHRHRHFAAQRMGETVAVNPASSLAPTGTVLPSWLPHIAPYPAGQGDTDGLSPDANECNRGCIDN